MPCLPCLPRAASKGRVVRKAALTLLEIDACQKLTFQEVTLLVGRTANFF